MKKTKDRDTDIQNPKRHPNARTESHTHHTHLTLYLLATQPTRTSDEATAHNHHQPAQSHIHIPTRSQSTTDIAGFPSPTSHALQPNTTHAPTHLRTHRSPTKKGEFSRGENTPKCGQSPIYIPLCNSSALSPGVIRASPPSNQSARGPFLSGAPQSDCDREYCGVKSQIKVGVL